MFFPKFLDEPLKMSTRHHLDYSEILESNNWINSKEKLTLFIFLWLYLQKKSDNNYIYI